MATLKTLTLVTGNRTNYFELTTYPDDTFTIAHTGERIVTDEMNVYHEAIRGRVNLRRFKRTDLSPKHDRTGLHKLILDNW